MLFGRSTVHGNVPEGVYAGGILRRQFADAIKLFSGAVLVDDDGAGMIKHGIEISDISVDNTVGIAQVCEVFAVYSCRMTLLNKRCGCNLNCTIFFLIHVQEKNIEVAGGQYGVHSDDSKGRIGTIGCPKQSPLSLVAKYAYIEVVIKVVGDPAVGSADGFVYKNIRKTVGGSRQCQFGVAEVLHRVNPLKIR